MAKPTKDGGVQLNALMLELINRCFWNSQMVAVRRLNDKSALVGKATKDKSVFSLNALLTDMQCYASSFTRQNIFFVEGREYDYKLIDEKHDEFLAEYFKKNIPPVWASQELNSMPITWRHEAIDELTGVTKANRSPTDCVGIEVFEKLKTRVSDACENIGVYVDKFYAHSATPGSRAQARVDEIQITLTDLWTAHECLCRTARFIGEYLLGTGSHGNYLAIPQFDQFAYIDRPFAVSEDVEKLRDFWHEMTSSYDQWRSWTPSDLF